jgi:hypothetical protein
MLLLVPSDDTPVSVEDNVGKRSQRIYEVRFDCLSRRQRLIPRPVSEAPVGGRYPAHSTPGGDEFDAPKGAFSSTHDSFSTLTSRHQVMEYCKYYEDAPLPDMTKAWGARDAFLPRSVRVALSGCWLRSLTALYSARR